MQILQLPQASTYFVSPIYFIEVFTGKIFGETTLMLSLYNSVTTQSTDHNGDNNEVRQSVEF